MSLIGVEVFHLKGFGNGIIVSSDNIDKNGKANFEVEFKETSDKRVFGFPEAFINKFLIPVGVDNIRYVDELINNHSCLLCGKYDYNVDILLNSKYCSNCKTKVVKCHSCRKEIFKNEVKYTDSGYHCIECYLKTHFKCSNCGYYYLLDELFETDTIKPEKKICTDCAPEIYTQCCKCDKYLEEKDVVTLKLEYCTYDFCAECYDEYVKKCNQCKQIFIMDNLKKCLCYSCDLNKRYLEYIKNLNLKNMTKEEYLNEQFIDMKSINLMTRLRATEKKSLHLYGEKLELLVLTSHLYKVSLVVLYHIPEEFKSSVNVRGTKYTLTHYKKNNGFRNIYISGKNNDVVFEMPFNDNHTINVWKYPFVIKAQTRFDMDYGDRYYWCGDELNYIDMGNNYGDTSEFCVIGYIENSGKMITE